MKHALIRAVTVTARAAVAVCQAAARIAHVFLESIPALTLSAARAEGATLAAVSVALALGHWARMHTSAAVVVRDIPGCGRRLFAGEM